MKHSRRRLRIISASVVIVALGIATTAWVSAVEYWISQELRALAAARLNPIFTFEDLTYTLPRTVSLRGIRLVSPDPEAPSESIEILAIDSLTLVLTHIPWPDSPLHMQELDLAGPTLRLVRIGTDQESGRLLGFSDLMKKAPEPVVGSTGPSAHFSDVLQARAASLRGGRVQFEPRDGGDAITLVAGIVARLSLQPGAAGAYDIDFSLDHAPSFALSLRGQLFADDERFEISALSSTLQLAREHDHYLTPAMQNFLAKRDIKGHLVLEAKGTYALNDEASSQLRADLQLSDASYAVGDYMLALEQVHARISRAGRIVTIEEFAIDALGGHAAIGGTFELDGALTGKLTFEGTDMQIGDLLRGDLDSRGVPAFSGLLGFSGELRGPFAHIDRRAQGEGRLSLKEARLARLPVLSTIDEAIDPLAEAAMKKEHANHDELSLSISFDGDRARIGNLRMTSRWYGLRGHGDVYFDSRLDLAVDGGPVQKLENELGEAGEVLGEITETLLRARVTGTLGEPKVGMEILRRHWP